MRETAGWEFADIPPAIVTAACPERHAQGIESGHADAMMESFTGALSCPPGSAGPQLRERRTIPGGGRLSGCAIWTAAPGHGVCRQVSVHVGRPLTGEHHAAVAEWEGRADNLLAAA